MDGQNQQSKMPKKPLNRRIRNYCSNCYAPTYDFRGPCRFPHGCCYSTMAILSAVGGMIMNFYVLGTCLFQRVQQINHVTGDPIPGSERGYGFLSRETDYGVEPDYRQCTYYPKEEYDDIFDGWMQTGRIFAFLSTILASVCFMILFLTCCMAFSPSMFERWLFWMYITAAISTALSFFIYGSEWCSENQCKVADGSGWAISAFMFHLVSANTVKSFAAAGAPRGRGPSGEDDNLYDEELDDLYYENENDKYPSMRPDGPRGVIVDKRGGRSYDNGEDYFDDMGRLMDPFDERVATKKHVRMNRDDDEEDDEDELKDISDHDLEEYASDDEDDEGYPVQYDENGNPIYDPKSAEHGHMGVGYENAENEVDEFGNPIQQYDEYGDPIHYDDYGIPVQPHDPSVQQVHEPHVDEYGNPIQQQPAVDEFGHPEKQTTESAGYDEYGNPMHTIT